MMWNYGQEQECSQKIFKRSRTSRWEVLIFFQVSKLFSDTNFNLGGFQTLVDYPPDQDIFNKVQRCKSQRNLIQNSTRNRPNPPQYTIIIYTMLSISCINISQHSCKKYFISSFFPSSYSMCYPYLTYGSMVPLCVHLQYATYAFSVHCTFYVYHKIFFFDVKISLCI